MKSQLRSCGLGLKRRSKGDIIVSVCYRLSDNGEQVDEALYRQLRADLCLQALIHMGDFNHTLKSTGETAGRKQSRRFFECIDSNFPIQVREPIRRDALLGLILANEGVVGNVKAKGSLGCSDHEMVEIRILRAGRKVKSKLTILDSRGVDFGLFEHLLWRVLWDKALEKRGPKKVG